MEVTRRYWTVAGFGAVLLVGAILFERSFLLGGAAAIAAWVVARQYMFIRRVDLLDEGLSIDQSLAPQSVATDEETTVTLAVALAYDSPLPFRVESNPPIAAVGSTRSDRTLDIRPGARKATIAYTIQGRTAGAFTFDAATVTVGDRLGLFRETLQRGATPTLHVQPRAPRNVHVGEGGDEIATAFGEHEAGRLGEGLEPAELREYAPGDAAKRIDWKATARLGRPFVREFDPETDRRTVLVVDHRAAMAQGPEGETKLDYARDVALGFVNSARDLDDPLGLYAVGDEGLTDRNPPDVGPQQYTTIAARLQAIRPTQAPDQHPDDAASDTGPLAARTPAGARRAASSLRDNTDAFATTLYPFYDDAETYIERIEQEPLFGAVRVNASRLRGTLWTVILTDDSQPHELRETVKLARRRDDHVLVFITPSVLFEPGGLGDLERAYDRYLAFEEFRRDLARMDRVTALEVGPGDRLDAILASQRHRSRGRGGGSR